jgi:contact-dependent growth inhibition (CDI) system CdiI-like immunity protein
MKGLKASDFPEMQRVFAGYLHEDFLEEHGTPRAALRAFHEDANASERQRFSRETRRFLERTAALGFSDVRVMLARLGCRWTPPSRKAMVAVFTQATNDSTQEES